MRGYYEIDEPKRTPTTRCQHMRKGVTNVCRVASCNQKEYVNAIVRVDEGMAKCIEEHGSGRVLTLNGASVFLYNPVLISVGQEGGL